MPEMITLTPGRFRSTKSSRTDKSTSSLLRLFSPLTSYTIPLDADRTTTTYRTEQNSVPVWIRMEIWNGPKPGGAGSCDHWNATTSKRPTWNTWKCGYSIPSWNSPMGPDCRGEEKCISTWEIYPKM